MWELDGGPLHALLSLDLRASDAQILHVSPSLGTLLGVSPSVDDPLSLYDFLSPSESCRFLNSLNTLTKGGGISSNSSSSSNSKSHFLYVFTSQSNKKHFCLEIFESAILNSVDVFRVIFKDHHRHEFDVERDDDFLSGFSVLLNTVNHKVIRVSPNFTALLGHSAHSVLGTPLSKWLHPQDESSFSTLKKRDSLRFRDAHGAFESFVYFSFQEVTKETFKMNFKVHLKEERIFSTLLQNEFRVRQVCCNNSGLQLPNLNHRNFLELVSSPDDLHYLENRIRKKVPGLTRLYEIRMNPKWLLWIQTNFFIYPNNDILAHHFIVKDKEEKSCQQHTLNQNNNVLKRKWPSGDVEGEDSTTQKNKLLRELLNINYSAQDNLNTSASSSSSVTTSTSSSSNSRILQLLNSKSPPDGGGRRKTPPSVSKSFMCSQNPALADLLSKPPYHASTSVPPPVPTKWHQEPREKLPRDIMRKYLPPHPAERSKLNTESSSPSVNSCRPSVADTDHDPMLSEILDGVIDIQEKTPGSSRNIVQKRINLSDIEKFLSAAEVQQSVPTNQLYSPMVRQSSAGSSSTPVPRINELLQVIPPNVTIPPNSEPSPYLLNVMSPQRRSSGRNHPPYDPAAPFSNSSAPHFSSAHLQHSQQQHLQMHHQQQQMNLEGRQEGSSSSPMPSSKGGGSLLLQLLSE